MGSARESAQAATLAAARRWSVRDASRAGPLLSIAGPDSSHSLLDLCCIAVQVVAGSFVGLERRLAFLDRLRLLGHVRQPRRRLAYVELAGDDVGDEAGAVLARREISRWVRSTASPRPRVALLR